MDGCFIGVILVSTDIHLEHSHVGGRLHRHVLDFVEKALTFLGYLSFRIG
jgi:hypothetical protein